MAVIRIEIISDTVCPWCYLGYRRLQRAIKLYQKTYPDGSKDRFELIWKPYVLDPNPPVESVSVHDRMLKKMSSERASQVQEHLKKLGVGEGIAFKFGGRVGSSMPSRQLLHLARSKGPIVQTTVAEELFRFLWECEKEISQTEILVEIGVLSGLDGKEVRQALKEGRGVEEVEKEQREAKEDGLDGVPHYVVGGKIHLEGAVDLGDFFNALVKAKESNGE